MDFQVFDTYAGVGHLLDPVGEFIGEIVCGADEDVVFCLMESGGEVL